MPENVSVQRLLRDKSPTFGLVFNNLFVEMSRIITHHFYGDLHLFLVLAAITNNSISRIIADDASFRKYKTSATTLEGEYRYMKLLPLSEIVGLPRTTVRRKVEKLITLGYIEHEVGDGYRLRRGVIAKSQLMGTILESQFEIIARLFNEMLRRDMVGVTTRRSRG
jgi:hypothetical protein